MKRYSSTASLALAVVVILGLTGPIAAGEHVPFKGSFETLRRTEDHHNIVSLVQAFPQDNETGTASGCEVDPRDLPRFHQ
jgi:hypothetical protein